MTDEIKITADMRQKANLKLARLLGYENIQPYGTFGHWQGSMKNHTGSVILPNWTDDWLACGRLLAELQIKLDFDHLGSVIPSFSKPIPLSSASSKEEAVRFAIVVGAIKKLGKEKEHGE